MESLCIGSFHTHKAFYSPQELWSLKCAEHPQGTGQVSTVYWVGQNSINYLSIYIHYIYICRIEIGEGDGTPLQYSCLENPMDEGTWQAAVHRVAKSRTRLSDFTFTFHFHALEKEMATHFSVPAWRIPRTGSLVGCRLWGRTESDTTEATQQQQQQDRNIYTQDKILNIYYNEQVQVLFG